MRGRVQGVGYRWFAQRVARELGLQGWIRNEPDGSVQGEAQGLQDDVGRFLAQLRSGPALSRVDALDSADARLGDDVDFVVR